MDQIKLNNNIRVNVWMRLSEAGLTPAQLHQTMIQFGGPRDKAALRKVLAGDGAICANTQRALCAALQTQDEKTLWEVWRNLQQPARVAAKTPAEPDLRLAQDYNPDAAAAEEALKHRMAQLGMFSGDDLPAPASKKKGLSYCFPGQVHVFHHFDFGAEPLKRKLSTLRRVLRRAL